MREPMGAVGLTARSMDFGVDQPRADAGDADAFGSDFMAKADGKGIDRAFGSGVVDICVGRAELGRN